MTPASATVLPTLRSIPPEMMTSVMARAAMPTGVTARNASVRLPGERKMISPWDVLWLSSVAKLKIPRKTRTFRNRVSDGRTGDFMGNWAKFGIEGNSGAIMRQRSRRTHHVIGGTKNADAKTPRPRGCAS